MSTSAPVIERTAPSFHSNNPKNLDYPEIVTVTESDERVESTEEKKLLYKTGASKGTVLVKKVAVTHRTIRTTTPYTGTV